MKISFLLANQSLDITGGSLAIYKHAENLTRMGHEVYLILPYTHFQWKQGDYDRITSLIMKGGTPHSPRASLISKLKKIIGKFIKPIISRLLNLLSPTRSMPFFGDLEYLTGCLIQNWVKCDVTIATYWSTAYAATFLSRFSTSFYYMQHYEELGEKRNAIIQRIKARMTYGLPIHLISCSSWQADQIKKRFGRVPFRTNHTVMQPDLFRTYPQSVDKKFSQLNPIKIISYCDPRPIKGWKYAVAGMKIIQQHYPNLEWRTYGKILDADGVKVTHMGRISDQALAQAYRESHIAIFPSLAEAYALQPIEMMACGCAVVTTPIGTEDYAKDKENCLIIQSKNIEDLVEKVSYLIDHMDIAEKLALEGLKEVDKFTWEDSTKQLIQIINDVKESEDAFADVDSLIP